MIREHKWTLIITSIIILLPMLAGDSFLSLCFLAAHWLGIIITFKDPKNDGQTRKALHMVFWILPVFSVVTSLISHLLVSGADFSPGKLIFLLVGLMFILVGNYLPKTKQNYTIGIKLPWTLASEENWNRTHRFGGRVWVVAGFASLVSVTLPDKTMMIVQIVLILAAGLIPTIYSYLLFKKQKESGEVEGISNLVKENYRMPSFKVGIGITAVVTVLVTVLLFTGRITMEYGEDSFTVKTAYWNNLNVSYDEIDSLEYRDAGEVGMRTMGFGSPKLLLGTFSNSEFGYYQRYSYTGCGKEIVLNIDDKVYVLAGKDEKETRRIYEELVSRIQ